MKPYLDYISGEQTPEKADELGAFAEDAVSEVAALASTDDDHETPAEAFASKVA